MEFCYPQDFLDEIDLARKNRQITASFLQEKLSNQGAEEARKISQIKAYFSSNQPCPISDKYWISERVEEDLNLKIIKVNVNF